jgi:hypothetical protein
MCIGNGGVNTGAVGLYLLFSATVMVAALYRAKAIRLAGAFGIMIPAFAVFIFFWQLGTFCM